MHSLFSKGMIFLLAVLIMTGISARITAQDIMDVAPGFETLNLAIEGDTSATGEPANPNRIYRLERGGYYLLNGSVENIGDNHLRIMAAEGEGQMPILIPAVDESGGASRAFRPRADGTFKGFYVSGIDNLGNAATKNMFRCEPENGRFVYDNLLLDYDAQSFIRMNAEGQKHIITNCQMRNSYLLADPGNGRFWDTRGNTMDSIWVQNCTFYMCTADFQRDGNGIIHNWSMDHVTVFQAPGWGNHIEIERCVNATLSNSLFIDFGFEGREVGDSTAACIAVIDTMGADSIATEAERMIAFKNNVKGYTPEFTAFIASFTPEDSVEAYPWFDQRTERFLAKFPNMVAENNLDEDVIFSDPPDPNVAIAYAQHRHATGRSNEGNPSPTDDRNGVAALVDDPLSVGPFTDEFDFDYATTFQAYTHAEGGFPVGDLNWFPDKKAEWETSGVSNKKSLPTGFSLAHNYPNPFNPTTSIAYSIMKSGKVELTVTNMLGQKIRTLVNKAQTTGNYSVEWNGQNDAGQKVASGVYFYQLRMGTEVQTHKMLMMK